MKAEALNIPSEFTNPERLACLLQDILVDSKTQAAFRAIATRARVVLDREHSPETLARCVL